MTATCANPNCGTRFEPEHAGHLWHSEQCYSGHLIAEIGNVAAGMRPLGLFGDRKKIRAFNRKWKPQ